DYIVPSRVNPGKFFALPQSPQLFKQLLMVSGMDRYYQITKCFRDEDLRANRQPEFTQVDIEMSFVDEDDVMSINEKLIAHIFKEILDIDIKLPLRRMPFDEAMDKYGVDKPDLRFGFLIHDVSSIFKNSGFKVFKDTVDAGNMVNAINVDGYQDKFTRKDITKLEDFAKTFGAKGLAWVKYVDNEFTGPIAKFFTDEEKEALIKEMDIKNNDLILFVADKKSIVKKTLGNLRNEIAKELNLNDPDKFELLWITDFPLFEYSEEEGRYMAMHHPFTHPKIEDIPYIEERKDTVKAKAYDIVINGEEIGGGSIRINNSDLQEKMFKALGFTKERAEEQFGFFIEAFKYGAPPHGGIAYGVDRFVQLLTKHDNIKDVIAFPKTQSATDLLTGAPSEVDDKNTGINKVDKMKPKRTIRTRVVLGDEVYNSFKDVNVLIVGIGGVGSFTLESLVRFGIEHITIVDYDTVSESNINRQILALEDTIGKKKVDVMRERLLKINDELDIRCIDKIYSKEINDEIFDRDYDYVVDAIDMLKNKIELIETCIEKDIKIISAMGCGNKLDPTKLEISTLDKTSVCPLARKLRQKIDKKVQKKINVVYSKELPIEKKLKDDDKVVTGSISFVTATGGLLIASKLVNDLLDGRK
ncbi:MAG: aspartate--tRNA ligase, partial [Fenollaria timonensis]